MLRVTKFHFVSSSSFNFYVKIVSADLTNDAIKLLF